MPVADLANHHKSLFIFSSCGDLDALEVFPQGLRLNEVNAVFLQISLALGLIEVEFHIGIINIPIGDLSSPWSFHFLWSNVAFSRVLKNQPRSRNLWVTEP